MRTKITEEHVSQIKALYQEGKSSYEIGKELNLGATSVRRILEREGVDRRAAGTIPADQVKIVKAIELYSSGISSEKIAEMLDLDASTVCRHLKKNGIEIRPATENKIQFYADETFFEIIDTEEKAYFLGFLYSDGNVHSKYADVKISLAEVDKEILVKLSQLIYKDDRVKTYTSPAGYRSCTLLMCREKIKEQLIKLGCMPDKCFKITYPEWMPDDLHRHFIRGFMDGDGCISTAQNRIKVDFTANKEFLDGLIKTINYKLNITGSFYKPHKERLKDTTTFSFQLNNNKYAEKFLSWIYEDSKIHMERKYQKYLEAKELIDKLSQKNYSDEEIDDIYKSYQEGKSMSQIGKELDINVGTISKLIKRKKDRL